MRGLQQRQRRRLSGPIGMSIECLEIRAVPSASMLHAARFHVAEVAAARSASGTIIGRIADQDTGRGVGQVRVELINSAGVVVQMSKTGPRGNYALRPRQAGAFVVHEIAPRGYVQTSPTFLFEGPSGDFAPGFGRSSWNYRSGNDNPTDGPVGPAHWDTIAPAGDRPFESPINLTGPTVDLNNDLSIHYASAVPKALINNGAQIQAQFNTSPSDTVSVGNEEFSLQQFHFHDTSENTLDGRSFPMEVHFVNANTSGAETVVAAFVELGAHNDAFDPILNAATADLGRVGSTTIGTPVNLAAFLPSNTQGYFYQGSLTTPPLSGPINWFVFATPITIDYAQLKQYEAVADAAGFLPNNRPVQPLDGRRLNEFDVDVAFTGGRTAGVDFALARQATMKTVSLH